MYVCVCVCMHVCMYVWMYVWAHHYCLNGLMDFIYTHHLRVYPCHVADVRI
jgi:hypothetical protein